MASNKDSDNILLQPMMSNILGASGTWNTFGFISNEEYLPQLLWRRGIEVYDHMRRSDASIQAMLKVVKHPLLAATWDIEPASDEEFDQYVARHVRNELFDRNVRWNPFLHDTLGKCDFGFSVFEKSYELTTGEKQTRVGIKELGWRKQWSILRWAMSNDEPGVTQELLSGPVDIPQEKLLTFVNDKEGDNYQGISLLRYVYKAWDFKKQIENLMMVDMQRSLGFPIVEYNPQASKNDQEKMENVLKNFRSHERQYMFMPEGKFKFDWAKIESNVKNFLPILEYLQKEIDKSVLAQFLDLGGSKGSGGSRALSQDHSQLFEKALEAIADEIVDELNANLIQQLCDLNWSQMPNGYPKIVYSNIGDRNVVELGDALNKIGSVDMLTPDPDMENKIRQIMDLPDLPDDIYNNYADRITAQSKAQPLTQLGPAQDPNAPAPNGQELENPPTSEKPGHNKPGTKLPGDQTNVDTRTNEKQDNANKPVPRPSSYKKVTADDALEEARKARMALQAAYMGA
jgi:phage gp29-like protein